MDYQQTLEYLFNSLPMFQRTGGAAYKASLKTTEALDRLTGFPHREFRSIHIAGTNGKGSVSHMLASCLQESRLRTGLYTSPHLLDFRERIRVNGKMIDKDYVVDFTRKMSRDAEQLKPSFFELTVAMAFCYFRDMKVDIAVIETGMGGRLDSTNIISPLVSVITNISLDHMIFLGNNIPAIAREKAGIIKEKIPVVVGQATTESMDVFESVARERSAPLHLAGSAHTFSFQTLKPGGNALFHFRGKGANNDMTIECDLPGIYQAENLLTSFKTLEVLKVRGIVVSEEAMMNGLQKVSANTGLRGRWETLGANPRIVCDTAHNEEGVKTVMNQLSGLPARRLHIIWGMVADKPADQLFRWLPPDAIYYLTRAEIERAAPPAALAEAALRHQLNHGVFERVQDALRAAMDGAGNDDVIFIGGSTFVVADALKFIPESH